MKKYKLLDPIHFGEETFTELEIMKPKMKHMMELDNIQGETKKTAKMIEVCANIPAPVVKELSIEDVEEISEIIAGFLSRKKRSGITQAY